VSARADLVAALATVPGLSVTSTAPDVIHTGTAWPTWRELRRPGGCVVETAWDAFVVLDSATLDASVDYAEEGIGALAAVLDALEAVGLVEVVEPIDVIGSSDGAAYPALRYRVVVSE
jgi:hypothetical protein